MTDVTALFRFKNKSKHPAGSVSFLRAIDYNEPGFKEHSKKLMLQVLKIAGGAGGPYYVDFTNVRTFASAVVEMPSGSLERREVAAYSEICPCHGVVEDTGMACLAMHMQLPNMSDVASGTGVVGVTAESFVRIYDSDGTPWCFTVLGVPLTADTPLNQKHVEQTFAIIGKLPQAAA